MSVDPLNPVLDYESDREFHKFIVQPQNWNGYASNRNNPLKYVDPDGRHPVVAGAALGFLFGAGIELVKQVMTNEPGQKVDWGKVGGAGVRGAIVGGTAAATGGLSLIAYAGASAAASVGGGIAGRATETIVNNINNTGHIGDTSNLIEYALDADSITVDALAGTAGGLAGKLSESLLVNQAAQRYLNNSEYRRSVQTLRNIDGKSDKQIGRARDVVQSGLNNFFWLMNTARNQVRAGTTAAVSQGAKKSKDIDINKCKPNTCVIIR